MVVSKGSFRNLVQSISTSHQIYKARDTWGSKAEFFLSCLGYAIGYGMYEFDYCKRGKQNMAEAVKVILIIRDICR